MDNFDNDDSFLDDYIDAYLMKNSWMRTYLRMNLMTV